MPPSLWRFSTRSQWKSTWTRSSDCGNCGEPNKKYTILGQVFNATRGKLGQMACGSVSLLGFTLWYMVLPWPHHVAESGPPAVTYDSAHLKPAQTYWSTKLERTLANRRNFVSAMDTVFGQDLCQWYDVFLGYVPYANLSCLLLVSPPSQWLYSSNRCRKLEGYSYSRTNNPTVTVLEQKLAKLENGHLGANSISDFLTFLGLLGGNRVITRNMVRW